MNASGVSDLRRVAAPADASPPEAPELAVSPLSAPPRAMVAVPGSKSITNRALLCAALAGGATRIEGALFADDTRAMADAVAAMGAGVVADEQQAQFVVTGVGGSPRPEGGVVIDARMSGTTGRFVVPALATGPTAATVDGHAQLRGRPFGDLIDVLAHLGVQIDAGPQGGLPLRVRGPITAAGPVSVSAQRSSQFLSGLMLAAPVVPGGLELVVEGGLVSRPYVEMTAAVMEAFGASVRISGRQISVAGSGYQSPGTYRVEPDASAACYFWAAAAVTGGTVGVTGLGTGSIQGDVAFAGVLESMGAGVEEAPGGEIVVTGGALAGANVDLRHISDTAPTMAVVAALAQGSTTVGGIGFIRGKESDRIAAPVRELQRCGVNARELPDGFEVHPDGPASGALIRTYDDHRMAMAFAVLGLVVPKMRIEKPGCVAKTFPGFFHTLNALRERPPGSEPPGLEPPAPTCSLDGSGVAR